MNSPDLFLHGIKRLAIMGGTFDPIHYGHLFAAEEVRSHFDIEKIIFIPSGRPPHKSLDKVSSNEHRYAMTALATLSNPYFEPSRLEIDRPGFSYTYDTLKDILKICDADAKIFFIIGADALAEVLTWKNPKDLFAMASFIVVTRPGINFKKQKSAINEISDLYGAKVLYLEIPAIDISSTNIRNKIYSGKSVKYLLPEEVECYIYKNNLYHSTARNIKKINESVKGMLSKKRYNHTLAVAEEAVRLAEIYGCDKSSAYLAGLLHDCAKEITDVEREKLVKTYGIDLDEFSQKTQELVHGIIGAKIANKLFGINDDAVLSAIKYHTTGKENMNSLEKIVFLADIIEPSRQTCPELSKVKEMACVDLDKAVLLGLKMKTRFLTEKKRFIHPLTLKAINYYMEYVILNEDKP